MIILLSVNSLLQNNYLEAESGLENAILTSSFYKKSSWHNVFFTKRLWRISDDKEMEVQARRSSRYFYERRAQVLPK